MKGDSDISQIIWHSWHDAFRMYPDNSMQEIGEGVKFLSNRMEDAFLMHLDMNFQYQKGFLYILWSILSLAATIWCTYFLLVLNPHIDLRTKSITRPNNNATLGCIVLFQHLVMVPMYTVLSCDYGRTIMYSVISSILMLYVLKTNNIRIPAFEHTTTGIMLPDKDRAAWLYSYWFYTVVVLFFPLTACGSINIPFNSLFFSF